MRNKDFFQGPQFENDLYFIVNLIGAENKIEFYNDWIDLIIEKQKQNADIT